MNELRLIVGCEPRSGPLNMAIDEAILESVLTAKSPATVRFYRWRPYAVSLGFFQSGGVVNTEECRRAGIDIVRRMSGGRAVLHGCELTYAISFPPAAPICAMSVVEAYRLIGQAIVSGLAHFGLLCSLAGRELQERRRRPPKRRKRASPASPACYDAPGAWEVTAAGRKLIGAAQVRSGGGLLQHGSIPYRLDRELTARVLAPAGGRRLRDRLQDSTVDLTELGAAPAPEMLAQAIGRALAEVLELKLKPGDLTQAELQRAYHLERSKYRSKEWTFRR